MKSSLKGEPITLTAGVLRTVIRWLDFSSWYYSTSENEKCPRKLIKKFDKKHFISINFFLCPNQNWFSSLWIYNPHTHSRPNPTFKSGKSIKIIDPWSFFYHHSDNLTWNNGHSLRRNFSPDLLLPLLKMKSKRFRVTKYTMV